MKEWPTLADRIAYGSSPGASHAWKGVVKNVRFHAHRMVIEDDCFEAITREIAKKFVASVRATYDRKQVDAWRSHAFLPHSTTWIETRRQRHGMLLETHPTVPRVFRATRLGFVQSGNNLGLFPERTVWTDEGELPESLPPWVIHWHEGDRAFERDWTDGVVGMTTGLAELGIGTYMVWGLLATLNNLPTVVRRVEKPGAAMIGSNYRKFLDHVTVELKIPQHQTVYEYIREFASNIRRRRHTVRAHVRVYHKGTSDEYERKIDEHMRGDASLGFVTHDYRVSKRHG